MLRYTTNKLTLILTPFSTPELTQSHNKLFAGTPNTTLYLLQIVPLPKNPWLHVQSKLPSVFKHLAFSSQMLILGSHSLISEKEIHTVYQQLVSHHSRIHPSKITVYRTFADH